jgi:hypothetical protein
MNNISTNHSVKHLSKLVKSSSPIPIGIIRRGQFQSDKFCRGGDFNFGLDFVECDGSQFLALQSGRNLPKPGTDSGKGCWTCVSHIGPHPEPPTQAEVQRMYERHFITKLESLPYMLATLPAPLLLPKMRWMPGWTPLI